MEFQKIILFFILISVGVFLGYKFFSKEQIANYPPKNHTIVAFGDSLVEGVGATSGNDFPSLVGRLAGVPVINEGKSGDTTEAGLLRIQTVLDKDPGIVILLFGGNDVLRRVSKEQTFKNLSSIIEQLQGHGVVVVLLGVKGGLLGDGYEEDYLKLSEKYHTLYVSNVLSGLITRPEYMYDSIHPNDKGYAIIAERVIVPVKRVLEEN